MEPEEISRLVVRASDGDQAAWNTIVDEYSGLLRSVVQRFRLGREQAADAAQTTWLRLVEHIDGIRDPARLAGWLRTTGSRACLEVIRESAREHPVDSYDDTPLPAQDRFREDATGSPEEAAVRHEHQALVRRAVAELPAKHRSLLEMLAASPPVSYDEIGARLGMPIGSIGPTRARILHKLRVALEAAGLHDPAFG
jgi:RNA polymerase sigma factor (sigma-70 family)